MKIERAPRHIAIILDGNGRWAKKRFMPRFVGHQQGLKAVREVVRLAAAHEQIQALTLFAFSTENWSRPEEEVSQLMKLFLQALDREISKLHENNIRFRVIGDISAFSQEIQAKIQQAQELTQQNSRLTLNIAANYGGRWDIIQSVKNWAANHPQGDIVSLREEDLDAYTSLAECPPVDLLIRTGGEQRISNFVLWQAAYAELYFSPLLWPDFNEAAFTQALADYASRERRFGKTAEQIQETP